MAMPLPTHALAHFHPLVRRWFESRFAAPTSAQTQAWPVIAAGENVLVSAPTGSGKTLTAFLSAIDALVTSRLATGAVSVLYVSPLKALNTDVRLNLLAPLDELRALFAQEGVAFPSIRVMTRSGDTPDDERRSMLRHPPEILITTPESLNLMLTAKQSRELFSGLKTVIVDEIHALAATKRGTYLMTAIERLALSAGEFQRIALSATVRPAQTVAAWMGGFAKSGPPQNTRYQARPVRVVVSTDARPMALSVRAPDVTVERGPDSADLWWSALADDLRRIIERNRSTLVFGNSRRTVEKIARLLNAGQSEPLAYAHHGSLSRELRFDVEERMKQGRLRAVVATGSLELGIDIGSVDEVILVGTPPSVAQTLQRIGRADHRVGGTSRASLFVLHGLDGVQGASMAELAGSGKVEEIKPIRNPLDVLAQVLLSMGCHALWSLDELYAFVRTIAAYHELPRRYFDLVVAMLEGRYADAPIRELRQRAVVDRTKNTFTSRPGTDFVLYQSGGTIPDRGYFHLRLADTKAMIGELDEEFVWERRLGDQFSLGTQAWRILNITHNDVEVSPADPHGPMIPFWKAEDSNRSTETSLALLDFLDFCEQSLHADDADDFAERLERRFAMDAVSAKQLAQFLERQREVSHAPLPGRGRVLVEYGKGSSPSETYQVILHTFWGGKVNRPLAIALGEAWERKYQSPLEAFATNDHIMLMMPEGVDVEELLALVPAHALDELLRSGLEKTALFGARFRENASRALLLPRGDARKRTPLWLNRIRAKKLLGSVLRFEDFPLVLETWREILEDEFDLTTLATILDDIAARRITLHVTRPAHLTPFSDGVVFRQTNYHMYLDDAATSGGRSNLADELFRDLFQSAGDLPAVPSALVEAFTSKLLRTHPDYRPSSRLDVLLAVREMPLLPRTVFATWLASSEKPQADDPLKSVVCYRLPGAADELVADAADLPRLLDLRGVAPSDLPWLALAADASAPPAIDHRAVPRRNDESSPSLLLGELLRGRGPLAMSDMTATLGWNEAELLPMLDELLESGSIVAGMLMQGRPERMFCDAEHAERLLRLARAARREATHAGLAARPITELPHFLLEWQGLGRATGSLASLQSALDRLFGFPASADLWEGAVLPCRLAPYFPSWMDTLFQSYGVRWLGCGKEKVSLVMMGEEDVLLEEEGDGTETAADDRTTEIVRHLRESGRGLGFAELATSTDESSATLAERLWNLAWQGRATTDSFETLRRGILSGFAAEPVQLTQTAGRAGFRRWQRSRPSSGHWQALDTERDTSPLARAERDKERARLVLDRYGVVFRELLEHELPPLRWSRIFRALRLLELSGEIVAGNFFAGIPGLQFASHEAVRRLGEPLPPESIYFVNACDPASVCGLAIEGLSTALPRRLASHWLVFHASQLLLVLQKSGKELSVIGEPAPAILENALGIYRFLLGREAVPQSSITVETINGQNASTSRFADLFRAIGFASDYRGMSLWKR